MNHRSNKDKMSPKISVLIRKNLHEVIRVTRSVQSDRRYCQFNNKGTDEMIFPLFQTYLLLRIVSIGIVYPNKKKSHGNSGLEEHSRTLHYTLTQYVCIDYSKINAPFSQNFSLNHRINT
jgi:hypothetical protein